MEKEAFLFQFKQFTELLILCQIGKNGEEIDSQKEENVISWEKKSERWEPFWLKIGGLESLSLTPAD